MCVNYSLVALSLRLFCLVIMCDVFSLYAFRFTKLCSVMSYDMKILCFCVVLHCLVLSVDVVLMVTFSVSVVRVGNDVFPNHHMYCLFVSSAAIQLMPQFF